MRYWEQGSSYVENCYTTKIGNKLATTLKERTFRHDKVTKDGSVLKRLLFAVGKNVINGVARKRLDRQVGAIMKGVKSEREKEQMTFGCFRPRPVKM